MEESSRLVLVAMVVAAAGPLAAFLTLLVVAPSLVAATSPETDGGIVETTGSLLVGLLIGGSLAVGIAWVVAAAATWAALLATGCPRAPLAWITCLVLSPLWLSALSSLELGPAAFLVLCGLLPGAVRLGFDFVASADQRTSEIPG